MEHIWALIHVSCNRKFGYFSDEKTYDYYFKEARVRAGKKLTNLWMKEMWFICPRSMINKKSQLVQEMFQAHLIELLKKKMWQYGSHQAIIPRRDKIPNAATRCFTEQAIQLKYRETVEHQDARWAMEKRICSCWQHEMTTDLFIYKLGCFHMGRYSCWNYHEIIQEVQ